MNQTLMIYNKGVPKMAKKERMVRHYHNNGAPIKNVRFPERNDPCPCGNGKKFKKCGMIAEHLCEKCNTKKTLFKSKFSYNYMCQTAGCGVGIVIGDRCNRAGCVGDIIYSDGVTYCPICKWRRP